jgi:hypothetical protein
VKLGQRGRELTHAQRKLTDADRELTGAGPVDPAGTYAIACSVAARRSADAIRRPPN